MPFANNGEIPSYIRPKKKGFILPAKVTLVLLEIGMLALALIFIFPILFITLNSVKTKDGVSLSPSSIPFGSSVRTLDDVMKEKADGYFTWSQEEKKPITPEFLAERKQLIRDYLGSIGAYDLNLETELAPRYEAFVSYLNNMKGNNFKEAVKPFGYEWSSDLDNQSEFLKFINPDKKSAEQSFAEKLGSWERVIYNQTEEVIEFLAKEGVDNQTFDKVKFIGTFTFDNFIQAWKLTKFPSVLLNTFIITVFSVLGIVFFASLASYMMVRTVFRRLGWVAFGFFTFAMLIPFQVLMVPLSRMAVDFGLTDMGNLVSDVEWLSSLLSTIGIVPMYWGLGVPFAIFMYHGFIKGVPLSLEESAYIDGASTFQTFRKIVFPLLTPITATIIILDVLWIWNDFLLPLIIIQKGTLQLAQQQFFGQYFREYGMAMASLVLSALPVVVFYLALQKYIIKGIAAGAVKG